MNYNRIYKELISVAKNRVQADGVYYEKHHILPKSMGGSNKKINIVKLTGREHLIAHMLLWKIYKNASMQAAIWLMSNANGIKINSRIYEKIKNEHANNVRQLFTGRLHSADTKEKLSIVAKGRISKKKGIKLHLSHDDIKKRSESRKGKCTGKNNPMSKESNRQKIRDNHATDEYKAKARIARLGHKPYNFKNVSVEGCIFESAAEAARQLSITYNCLIRRIRLEKYTEYFYI